MSNDLNRQCVLNMLDCFYAGDVERALACCSDDIEFVTHAPIDLLPHLGHRRGKDDVREMWQAVQKRYSSMRHEVLLIVVEDDKVAANIRVHFRKTENDRVVQFDIAHFYTLVRGKIASVKQILDSFDLVEQLLERDVVEILGQPPA